MIFNNPDDFSSSPEGSTVSDDTENQTFTTADGNVDSSDSDDNDLVVKEDTIVGIDEDNTTSHSIASVQSAGGSSTSSSGRLERSLRQASVQAGTQGIEYDEHGDISMEMADDEVTNAFTPLVQQRAQANSAMNFTVPEDKENINPFSPAFKANLESTDGQGDDMERDQTMDFTQAAGAILAAPVQPKPSPKRGRPKAGTPKRRSSGGRRRSSGSSSAMADETMDLTAAVGGIQQIQPFLVQDDNSFMDENEDLTMEFTAAVGGLLDKNSTSVNDDDLANQQLMFEQNRRASVSSTFNDDTMDMTMAVGGILTSITERTEPSEDETGEMDITKAIGAILPNDLKTNDRNVAKKLMEEEAEHGQLSRSPFGRTASQEVSADKENHGRPSIATSETGSPSLVTASARNTRRNGGPRPSTTPKVISRQSTPLKKPVTPSKQLTPQPQRPTTPAGKTPPSKNVAMRLSSPKRLFKAEIKKAAATTTPKSQVQKLMFHENAATGTATPSIVFTPVQRFASGLGVDKEGLGSPRVTALLDRRVSIGDAAESFTPLGRTSPARSPFPPGVRFEDPVAMLEELEHERAETERRESGRGILQMEADPEEEKDVTANLRDMIESLTPKKNKLKGRKSLHVGAARGLLGKRPAELDEDDEEDPSPKRVAGNNRSPVKSIKLPAPPSKDETTGRLSKAPRFSLAAASGNQLQTPTTDSFTPAQSGVTTPKNKGRYKDTELVLSAAKPPVTFNDKLTGVATTEAEPVEEEERIQLQDFLNMTSIRFMELTTTKRRHTIAPNNGFGDSLSRSTSQGEDDRGLESCVVAGACTVPMLELYQHVSDPSSRLSICALTNWVSPAASLRSTSPKAAASFMRSKSTPSRRTHRYSANISLQVRR